MLEDLAAATHCRARLGVLQDLETTYIQMQPGRRPVSAFVPAAILPTYATALGRALLAFAPPSIIELTILGGLRAYMQHTITSPARLQRALALTRATRVAVTRFKLEASTCTVAVPVASRLRQARERDRAGSVDGGTLPHRGHGVAVDGCGRPERPASRGRSSEPYAWGAVGDLVRRQTAPPLPGRTPSSGRRHLPDCLPGPADRLSPRAGR